MVANNPLSFIGFGSKKKPVEASPVEAAASEPEKLESGAELAPAPYLSVLKGDPSDEELAALTLAILALQRQEEDTSHNLAAWQKVLNRRQKLGIRLRPGPGSWRRAQPM